MLSELLCHRPQSLQAARCRYPAFVDSPASRVPSVNCPPGFPRFVSAAGEPPHADSSSCLHSRRGKLAGVNPIKVDWIAGHESHYGQRMRGDDGLSRGFWMISGVYHPEVSDACADDLPCSIEWSLNRILAGHINEWSAFRFCRRLWPQSCPF